MFNVERITDKVYPEVFGVGTYCGAEVFAAAIDKRVKKSEFPIAQTITTVGSLIGGAAMIGYNKYPEIGTGLFAASGITAFANAVRYLYAKATKEKGQKGTETLALIPATYEGKQVGSSGKKALFGANTSEPLDVTVEEEGSEVGTAAGNGRTL